MIYCSDACSILVLQNLHLEFSKGEDDPQKPAKQVLHTQDIESDEKKTPTFSPLKPDNLIGYTFLTTPTEDGQCFCAHIIYHIKEIYDSTDKVHTIFLIHRSDDELDEIMAYHVVSVSHGCLRNNRNMSKSKGWTL